VLARQRSQASVISKDLTKTVPLSGRNNGFLGVT
jgi:hypothetical protein